MPRYCGRCCLCNAPGHVRHHPGCLPYTGSWCDTHFDQMAGAYEVAFAASEPASDEPFGLPKQDCLYFLVTGLFTYRRLFKRYFLDAYLEYCLNILTRYVLRDQHDQSCKRHARWDHPLGMWLHSYPMERDDSWQSVTEDEFEAMWQRSPAPKTTRRRAEPDSD